MKNVISFSELYNVFFVLGFFLLTYTTNIYVLFAFVILFCFFIVSDIKFRRMLYVYLASIIIMSVFYYFIHDGSTAYRIFKTLTLVWITFLIPVIHDLKVSKLLHYFILFNALLVYIDCLLYNSIGFSLTNGVETDNFMRFSGLLEDSNFFSYLLFVYIYYLKIKTGKFNLFLIGAVLLSFSLSIILVMVGFIILFQIKGLWRLPDNATRILGGVILVVIFFIYYGMLFVLTTFRNVDTSNDYIAVKLVSLSLRFESQLEAFDALSVDQDYIWGMGAGKTRDITTKGMNLHNTYLQIFLEMGACCLLIVFAFGVYCYRYLDKHFILLFVAICLLGNILEVFYFPLLSFILFLSVVYKQEKENDNSEINKISSL